MLKSENIYEAFDDLESKQVFKINELLSLVQRRLADKRTLSQLAPIDEEPH